MMTRLIVKVANICARDEFAIANFRQFFGSFMEIWPATIPFKKLAVRIQVQSVATRYSFIFRDTKPFNGWSDFVNHCSVKKVVEWVELSRNAIAPFSFWHEKFQ